MGSSIPPKQQNRSGNRTMSRTSSGCILGSAFQSSVVVGELTGPNPTEDIPSVKATEELSRTVTTHSSQRKIHEEHDHSAYDNFLSKQNSIADRTRWHYLSLLHSGSWLSAATIPTLGLQLPYNEFRVAL